MKFTYINFLPLLDDLEKQNLKVSFVIVRNMETHSSTKYQISSILHHKDYQFPSAWSNFTREEELYLKGTSSLQLKEFLSQACSHEKKIPKYTLLTQNDNNFLLHTLLKNENLISFNSTIHDQIATPEFMNNLENKWFDYYLNNKQHSSPSTTAFFEYPILKFFLDNMDSMKDENLEENYYYLYTEKSNQMLGKLHAHNICPLEIMPVHELLYSKIIESCGKWLEKNYDDESIKQVTSFFNHQKYKNIFSTFLKDINNREHLENYIFSISNNNNEVFKNSIYQNFPFFKFDMPTYTSLFKKDSLQLNILSILKDSKKETSYSLDEITFNKEELILKNLQKIVNKASKFYGLTPFKIKKFKNGIFNLETSHSDIEKNKKVGEFLNIMLYELFVVAKPVDSELIKTLDTILPFVHSQVLNLQIPSAESTSIKINKF